MGERKEESRDEEQGQNMKPQVVVRTVFSSGLASGPRAAQVELPGYRTSVRLQVSVPADDDLRNRLLSYCGREIRSLADVDLVSEGARINISLIALRRHDRSGSSRRGYSGKRPRILERVAGFDQKAPVEDATTRAERGAQVHQGSGEGLR
jgi:hypothetical protein